MTEFVTYILDMLKPLELLSVKRMFGSIGLFYGEFMFALIKDEQLYIKADAASKVLFIEANSESFYYFTTRNQKRKRIELSYYAIPDSALDNQDELFYWVQLGIEASHRKMKNKALR